MNAINVETLKKEDFSMTNIYFNNDGDIVLEDYNQGKTITYKRYQMQVEEEIQVEDSKE